jgi:hypothetical protein
MKTLFLLLTCWAVASSQTETKTFNDCGSLQSVFFTANDLVLIQCDTVFVLNKLTFRRYDAAYRELRRKGSNISKLMSSYDELITLQQHRIEEQGRRYDSLHTSFTDLSTHAGMQVSESSTKLSAALTSMESLKKDLVDTKNLLGEAKEIIQSEQRRFSLNNLLWGAGGVVAGIVVGVLITK